MRKLVDIEDVTVSYREEVALKRVSLKIEEGVFLAVIGPNGAGKTTLLTVMNGLARILSGSVRVFGVELTRGNASQIRREIGYVPQEANIDPRSPICVRDVVLMGRFGKIGLFRRPSSGDYRVAEQAMDLVGVSELSERPIGHLSGGQQQKVAIARALAQQPRILLFDEPTQNLDPKAQKEIMDIIDGIYQEKRVTIVFVTHILSHLPRSCNEAVLLKGGEILYTGKVSSALTPTLLSQLYECPIEWL